MNTTKKPKRTDAELRAMHAEKQAALTLRMARKALPRIKGMEDARDVLIWLEAQDGFTEAEADSMRELQIATERVIDENVKRWDSKQSSVQV